jgi:molybdenum cofactor synthesis domain-containing protein
VDRLHRNDERPDWHQALRPNDGWSAYHRSDTTNKVRLRVSIEPPNINVSEITLQLSEGKCPITRGGGSPGKAGISRFRPSTHEAKARVDARGHGPSIRTTAGPKATASFSLHRFILWCVLLQVIMTTADTPAPKEAVTAALLVIGDRILSGRTKDQNIGYVAEYLTALGMHLAEVRVIGDEETAIVDAVNALRHRYNYVFTTGGIGPTHDDITADSVAKAFRMPIDVDPRALAILHEWLKATGAEMNEARLRMTRIPNVGPMRA